MKKALSVFLMAAMAFGAFADEPVADVNVAEFSGNAAVQWGVDLDSGTTGFQNSTEVNLKLNLLNNGTKSTTGDGVWGELVLKTDGDSFIQWQQKAFSDEAFNANKGMQDGGNLKYKVYVDVAKINIGPAYIGIKTGNTQTGALKMDAAIRSADDDQGKWLYDVGPDGYSQGIVAGYDSDMFKIDLDLRSKPVTSSKMVSQLVWITKVTAPDGADKTGAIAINANDVVTLSNGKTVTGAAANVVGQNVEDVVNQPVVASFPEDDATYYYTDNYAAALEGEFKGVENLSIKAGVSYNFAENYQANKTNGDKTPIGTPQHTLGYSASAGYKLGLNDTFFLRPQVGFAGLTIFAEDDEGKGTGSSGELAFGVLFGWGDIGQDKNAGVYFLDDNMAKKVTPGVGVVASIPLATTAKYEPKEGDSTTTTAYGPVAARIMPSFFSGELVPGLTAAAYGDIVVVKTGKDADDGSITYAAGEKAATPMAFALGAKYAIGVDEITITPQAGLRFANAAYVDYNKAEYFAEKDDAVFGGMGEQKEKAGGADEKGITSDGDYLNVKLGVEVAGLIDNTTLGVEWASRNVLNNTDRANWHDPKLGTLNFKAKIAL